MSLKTSLNVGDFESSALPEPSEASQAPVQNQPAQGNGAEDATGQKHEASIPYPRFQEVAHENQDLRSQIQRYEQQLAQVRQQQQQVPQSISGMQNVHAPQAQAPGLTQQQQQVVDSFREQLQDPQKSKEWQNRIAREGPVALQEFVEKAIQETGSRMLGEALRPLLEKVSLIEGDYVTNTLSQYEANVNDPEFPAYRHLFQTAVRHVAPTHNIRDQQTLDTIRYWAQAQYRATYGNPPQYQQQQQYQQPQYGMQQQQQPLLSERPGNSHGFQPARTQDRYARVDADLASKFGLDPQAVQQARMRTVRGG